VALPLIAPVVRALGYDLRATVLAAAAEAGLPAEPARDDPVAPDEIADLPDPVRRYLDFMRVVGQPRVWSFLARFRGRFRLRGRSWMPADAWQYNCAAPAARLFHMRLDFARVIPMVGKDTYLAGRGGMDGRLLGVIPVARGEGAEFDASELTTYLNDALVLAPSMLLGPSTTWTEVGPDAFDVELTHAGRSVTGRVLVDQRGAMRDFATTDRWADLPDGLVQARWTTPFDEWETTGPQPLPASGRAVWHLEEGPLTYVEGAFVPGSVERNVRPD
jgi:hypothetical protein